MPDNDVRHKAAAILSGHKLRMLEEAGLTVVDTSRVSAAAEIITRHRLVGVYRYVNCGKCGAEIEAQRPIMMDAPYCGGCGKIVFDLAQGFCGWCGAAFTVIKQKVTPATAPSSEQPEKEMAKLAKSITEHELWRGDGVNVSD